MPTKDRSIYVTRRGTSYHQKFGTASQNWGASQSTKLIRTRTGVSLPGWRDIILRGENATTSMSGTWETIDFHFVGSYAGYGGRTWVTFRDHGNPSDATIYRNEMVGDLTWYFCADNPSSFTNGADASKAYNKALVSFLKKVRQAQVAWSAPTFLGELRESIHMIRHPASALNHLLGQYLKDVKRLKRTRPRNWKKGLSGLWLEYAFGWVPLVSDIGNAYQAYKDLVTEHDGKYRMLEAGAIDEASNAAHTKDLLVDMGPTVTYYSGSQRGTSSVRYKFRGAVVRHVDATIVGSRLETFGFEAQEWVPTAWELLPWSFLVDYFSNIGDVIQANCAVRQAIGWVNQDAINTRTIEYSGGHDLKQTKAAYPKWIASDGPSFTVKWVLRSVVRTPGVTLPTPQLALDLPGKPAQWTNCVALFAQANAISPQKFHLR